MGNNLKGDEGARARKYVRGFLLDQDKDLIVDETIPENCRYYRKKQ